MKRFCRVTLLVLAAAACTSPRERARRDSARAAAEKEQELNRKLAAQKDSLTNVVLEADNFISQIDSQISRVKGLPKRKQNPKALESPLQEQVQARKDMMLRVGALVERAQATAAELAATRKREQELRGDNERLQLQIDKDQELINALGATIQRKSAMIAQLETRVDSVMTELKTAQALQSKAFYIIGSEDELLQKGVIVREGGANLLIIHPGRTLQPARKLDLDLFKAIDRREVREITVPDTSREYTVVSRQSLDNAEVAERYEDSFRGNLRIANIEQFWAPSRFLIIVQH
jgi:hypothetical protein